MEIQNETKRINVRLGTKSDADLVKRAAAKCGITVAEWSRRALVKIAEEQIHGGGVEVITLKNVLLTRRMLEIAEIVSDSALNTAKDWARIQAEDATRFGSADDEQDGE